MFIEIALLAHNDLRWRVADTGALVLGVGKDYVNTPSSTISLWLLIGGICAFTVCFSLLGIYLWNSLQGNGGAVTILTII